MHLRSLTLRGFKSFASATTFEFTPGINAVVGPNGCGKSNIVDALAWVMGEQGAKSLRGGSMQDVIFAGAGTDQGGKSALGRAKVSLRIDNSDSSLSIPSAEIEICRTMFRAGGSEYEINGSPARLADVHDLLSEAGLGPEMHVLIGQGQLDRILHASAAERREVIEEAAGILKYRRRQDKTARKLEAMGTNLTRLTDLAAELETQLKPLGEQAESAATARELQGRIRELNTLLIARQIRSLDKLLHTEHQRVKDSLNRAEELQHQGNKIRATGEQLTADLEATRAAHTIASEELSRLKELLTRTQAVASIAAERAKTGENAADLTGYDADIARAAQQVATDEKTLATAQQTLEQARTSLEKAAANVEQRTGCTRQIEDALTARAAEAEKMREHHAALAEAAAVARAEYNRARIEEENRHSEVQLLEQEATEIAEQIADAATKVEGAATKRDTHTHILEKAQAARTQAETARDTAREGAVLSARQAAAARERTATLRQALGAHLLDAPALDEAETPHPTASNLLRVLDAITIEPGWEKAAASALAALATAALNAPEGTSISRIVPGFIAPNQGRTEPGASGKQVVATAYKNAVAAGDIVHLSAANTQLGTDGKGLSPQEMHMLQAALTAHLEGTYCVESAADARAVLTAGARQVIDRNGVTYVQYAELHPQEGATALELAAAARTASTQADQDQKKADQAHKKFETATKNLARAVAAERDTAKVLGQAQAAHEVAEAAQTRLTIRAESMQHEILRARQRLENATQAVIEAQGAYTSARTALENHEEEHLAQQVNTARAQHHQLTDSALTQARASLKEAEKHLADANTGLARAEAEYRAGAASVERARQVHRHALTAREQAATAHANIQHAARCARSILGRAQILVKALTDEVAASAKNIAALSQTTQQLMADRADYQAEEREVESARSAALTLVSRSETEIARVETRRENLAERARLVTGLTLEEVAEAHPPTAEGEEEISNETIRNRLAQTQAALDELGNVNPLALEEYEALTDRHTYLREQIADLKKSRADLNTVMGEVTTRITEVFTTALADINTHYERIFATLFPGGQGSLELAEPENVLGSGVEIFARPAGKKVKRLSLLSGGERSLASLALLVAIFMARPSPFYALDEVEAALDDRNLSRLLTVLEQLGEQSQLILITHQKRTMQLAQTLYGVSMHGGVSSVISQDVQQLRGLL